MTSNQGRTSTGQTRTAISRTRHLTRSSAVRFRALVAAAALALTGCSLDGLLKSDELPKDVTNPALLKTRQGALAAYRGVIVQFRRAFAGHPFSSFSAEGGAGVVPLSGALTDELQTVSGTEADKRAFDPAGTDVTVRIDYSGLQQVRGQASQDLGLLRDYAPDQSALAGHVYALQGYAEVFLAELFCSGIPLSTLDYNGDFTLSPGLTTAQVLTHALALFDTALAVGSDSARIMDFARIGKARALLDLGDYTQAAAMVTAVADDYSYDAHYGADYVLGADDPRNFASVELGGLSPWGFSVADREGTRGLDYVSSGDPRTAVRDASGLRHPMKYAVDGSSPIVVASGVEARLIEAEAALQADDAAWLVKLNTLRTDGTQDGSGNYNPGTGGVAGLAPLDDPGAAISDPAAAKAARVDLLFRERAFWLFLTGHRQGDLRRLLRQYGRSHDQVYPIGPYPSGGVYGGDVTVPIPDDERRANPKFTGCASRGA